MYFWTFELQPTNIKGFLKRIEPYRFRTSNMQHHIGFCIWSMAAVISVCGVQDASTAAGTLYIGCVSNSSEHPTETTFVSAL